MSVYTKDGLILTSAGYIATSEACCCGGGGACCHGDPPERLCSLFTAETCGAIPGAIYYGDNTVCADIGSCTCKGEGCDTAVQQDYILSFNWFLSVTKLSSGGCPAVSFSRSGTAVGHTSCQYYDPPNWSKGILKSVACESGCTGCTVRPGATFYYDIMSSTYKLRLWLEWDIKWQDVGGFCVCSTAESDHQFSEQTLTITDPCTMDPASQPFNVSVSKTVGDLSYSWSIGLTVTPKCRCVGPCCSGTTCGMISKKDCINGGGLWIGDNDGVVDCGNPGPPYPGPYIRPCCPVDQCYRPEDPTASCCGTVYGGACYCTRTETYDMDCDHICSGPGGEDPHLCHSSDHEQYHITGRWFIGTSGSSAGNCGCGSVAGSECDFCTMSNDFWDGSSETCDCCGFCGFTLHCSCGCDLVWDSDIHAECTYSFSNPDGTNCTVTRTIVYT